MAQQESISRKVFAGVLIGIILATLGLLAKWLLPGLVGLAATFLLTIWRWFIHLVSVPAWLLTVLSLYVGMSLIRRAYLWRRSRTQPKSTTVHILRRPAPNWQDYRCDVFHEIIWRWHYDNRGQPVEILPFCFKCDTQINPAPGHSDALAERTNYFCDNCGNRAVKHGSHNYIVDRVFREIQRKLRSPSKEWTTAIKAHAGQGR